MIIYIYMYIHTCLYTCIIYIYKCHMSYTFIYHISYFMVHVQIQYHIHVLSHICIRQAQKSSQNSEGSWFCAFCPLTPWRESILVEPLCTKLSKLKRRRFWLGSENGWRTRSERRSLQRLHASPDRHCSVFTWQVEKVYSDFDKETASIDVQLKWHEMTWNDMKWHEMTWNDMKWHEMTWNDMKWHEMTFAMFCCNVLPHLSLRVVDREVWDLSWNFRWIWVAQPTAFRSCGQRKQLCALWLWRSPSWRRRTADKDRLGTPTSPLSPPSESFRIKIFSRSSSLKL